MLSLFVLCWLHVQLQVGFVSSQAPSKGQAPTNVTITTKATSMVVTWDPPDVAFDPSLLESYRIRLYEGLESMGPHRVYWVAQGKPRRETITCLKPATVYRVQLFSRFTRESNLTDGGSELKHAITKEDRPDQATGFLHELVEHNVIFGLGVAVGAGVVVIVWILWCCWRCRRCCGRRGGVTINDNVKDKEDHFRRKKKKKTKLKKQRTMPPSAKELRAIEQRPPMNVPDSTPQSPTTITRATTRSPSPPANAFSPSGISISSISTAARHRSPPPFCSQAQATGLPVGRPYMPSPTDTASYWLDDDDVLGCDYQNTSSNTYPPSYNAVDDMPLYGNV